MKALRLKSTVAVCACLTASAVLALGAAGSRGPFGEHCEYVEAGPPGPRGNKLVVVEDGPPIWVVRDGPKIGVKNLFSIRCDGRQATVNNIDRIVLRSHEGETVRVDASEGALAPGASPERGAAEIEISADLDRLEYRGTDGGDWIVARTRSDGDVAINVNPRAERQAPDPDIVNSGRPRVLKLVGGPGDDRIDARGLTGMGDDRLERVIRLFGDAGNDVILGSPGGEWRLHDGPGNDLVRTGGGNDSIDFDRGRDTIFGGRGNDDLIYEAHFERSAQQPVDPADRLFGGPGPDQIIDLNGHFDLIHCGRGFDEVERDPRDRPAPDCERLR